MGRERERDYKFELKLANGKSRQFETADEIFVWAQHNCRNFNPDDKLDLSEWFEKRSAKKPK